MFVDVVPVGAAPDTKAGLAPNWRAKGNRTT